MEKLVRTESDEDEIGIEEIHQMLDEQRRKALPQLPWANHDEYLAVNGTSLLRIIRDPKTGIYKIIHQKNGEKIVIPTPEETIKGYGIVSLQGTNSYFATALLLQFHGDHCERQSRKVGGSGYDRF